MSFAGLGQTKSQSLKDSGVLGNLATEHLGRRRLRIIECAPGPQLGARRHEIVVAVWAGHCGLRYLRTAQQQEIGRLRTAARSRSSVRPG